MGSARSVGVLKPYMRCSLRPELPAFDAQIHFQPLGYEVTADKVILAEANRVSLAVNVSRPQSRGSIRLRSPNPQDAPVIDHPLVGSDADIRTLIDGARVMRRIFQSPQLRETPGAACGLTRATGRWVRRSA